MMPVCEHSGEKKCVYCDDCCDHRDIADEPDKDTPKQPPNLTRIDTREYRLAPGGEGEHAATWEDKPHRLIYDLCQAVDRLQAIVGVLEKTVINTVISTPLIGNDVTIHSKTEAECQELMTLFVQLRITTKAAAEAAEEKS